MVISLRILLPIVINLFQAVQHHIGVTIGIDSSLGEAKTLEVNGCAVYYIDCEEPIFIWNDGKYVMILESEERLLIEEFEKIIRGIKTE